MNTLGLAVIARDEEKRIGNLLASVKGLFDQIVVVDTGSKDKTREVAKSFGAEVYDLKDPKAFDEEGRLEDFSIARNYSFSFIKCDWVSWLDCDDILTPENLKAWLDLKQRLGEADAYLMWYDYSHDEYGKPNVFFRRHRILRMAKRPRWVEMIHEHLDMAGWGNQRETEIHVTHKRDGESVTQDRGRNIRILEKAVRKDPKNPRLMFYYGKELHYEGRNEEMVRVLEQFIKVGGWVDDVANAHYWVSKGYYDLGKKEESRDAALRGIGFDPRWAELFCLVGLYYYERNEWARAIPWYEIAASCLQPATWGTVQPDYYTTIPRIQLAKCYAEIGNLEKSYIHNQEVLATKPAHPMGLFNLEYLRDRLYDRFAPRPVRLNLGAGGKPTSGYRNCDLHPGPGVELKIDQSLLPYHDHTVHAIRSEHALEHSDSHARAEETITEWARGLRHGGTLHLMVPDLEECARKFLASEDRPRRPGEKYTEKEWYKYTIYGYQQSLRGEPIDGQFHRTGFTKASLRELLVRNGFEIRYEGTYDGWGTPSLEFRAVQTKSAVRVAWLLHGTDENDPSTRIRRLNIHRWLGKHGVESTLMAPYQTKDGKPQDEEALFAIVREFDAVVFTSFGEYERRVMEKLILSGVSVIADYNEDLAEVRIETARCLEASSVIVCCSPVLAERAQKYGRTVVIPDAFETPVDSRKKVYAFDVDDTLEVSHGPVTIRMMQELATDGHKVGLCGNWKVFLDKVPQLASLLAFCGPHGIPKEDFLRAVKGHHQADDHIMVGNVPGVSGASDDIGAAKKAGWKFIREMDFARGERMGSLVSRGDVCRGCGVPPVTDLVDGLCHSCFHLSKATGS
jgi:glycosyltransferase involved in cell wall biosynthesis